MFLRYFWSVFTGLIFFCGPIWTQTQILENEIKNETGTNWSTF